MVGDFYGIFGVADLRYDGLRNWDILELKVVD